MTVASHLFGQNYLQGDEFTGDKARWGSVSDWFSGVVGVSIGLAGSAIAIWLAYRVEKLTVAQNQMANVQAWRETYIDSGDIAARAELASRVYNLVQKMYSNLVEIKKIDIDLSRATDKLDDQSQVPCEEASRLRQKAIKEAELKSKPHSEEVFDALSELVSMLSILRRKDLTAEVVLGMAATEVEKFAKECMGPKLVGEDHTHQLAERITDKGNSNVHVADAVKLMLRYTSPTPIKLATATHKLHEYYPDDVAEFFWEQNATTVGKALKPFENYLPLARSDKDIGGRPISWVRAYCDFVMDEVNPYRYAREAIFNDLQIGDVSPRQEKRLELLSNLAISKVLDSNPYIRDIFPSSGYEQKVKAIKVKDPVERPVDPDEVPISPKVKLQRNRNSLQ